MTTNDDLQNNGGNEREQKPDQQKNYAFFTIAAICCGLSALTLALAFAVPKAGVYMLVASILSGLASLAFLNNQKKKYDFKFCTVLRVVTYAVLLASLIIFILGAAIASK